MFAAFSGVDVFLGPSTTYTSYGNVVNIPEISIPYGFAPATVPSNYTASTPRKNPLNVGIYGLPYTDSKVRLTLFTPKPSSNNVSARSLYGGCSPAVFLLAWTLVL